MRRPGHGVMQRIKNRQQAEMMKENTPGSKLPNSNLKFLNQVSNYICLKLPGSHMAPEFLQWLPALHGIGSNSMSATQTNLVPRVSLSLPPRAPGGGEERPWERGWTTVEPRQGWRQHCRHSRSIWEPGLIMYSKTLSTNTTHHESFWLTYFLLSFCWFSKLLSQSKSKQLHMQSIGT